MAGYTPPARNAAKGAVDQSFFRGTGKDQADWTLLAPVPRGGGFGDPDAVLSSLVESVLGPAYAGLAWSKGFSNPGPGAGWYAEYADNIGVFVPSTSFVGGSAYPAARLGSMFDPDSRDVQATLYYNTGWPQWPQWPLPHTGPDRWTPVTRWNTDGTTIWDQGITLNDPGFRGLSGSSFAWGAWIPGYVGYVYLGTAVVTNNGSIDVPADVYDRDYIP